MAREEQDREDLLRDATVFTHRAEWSVPFCAEPVFVGFRPQAGPSFYLGQDEVYHFNLAAELRRGFLHGKLLKAEGGRLVELTRRRQDQQVQLVRRELPDDESAAVIERFQQQLRALQQALTAGSAELLGQVLPEKVPEDVATLILNWLPGDRLGIARSARSG